VVNLLVGRKSLKVRTFGLVGLCLCLLCSCSVVFGQDCCMGLFIAPRDVLILAKPPKARIIKTVIFFGLIQTKPIAADLMPARDRP